MSASTISIPWAILAHDNHRLLPVVIKGKIRQITAPGYRKAKASVGLLFSVTWKGPRIDGPVEVHGRAWFPDLRKRDAGNYRKLLTDCLTGIAYDDDSQIVREIWEKAGLDRESPRIELTISRAA